MEGIDPWAGTAAVRRALQGQFPWVSQNNACLEARTALGNVMVERLDGHEHGAFCRALRRDAGP